MNILTDDADSTSCIPLRQLLLELSLLIGFLFFLSSNDHVFANLVHLHAGFWLNFFLNLLLLGEAQLDLNQENCVLGAHNGNYSGLLVADLFDLFVEELDVVD